jgi:hypothetical protein
VDCTNISTCEGIRDNGDRKEETIAWQFDSLSSQLHSLAQSLDKIIQENAKLRGALQAKLDALGEVDSINL